MVQLCPAVAKGMRKMTIGISASMMYVKMLVTADLTSKHEAHFNHATWLIWVRARRTKDVARREAGRPNKRKVSSSEETLVLKGWCQRDRLT